MKPLGLAAALLLVSLPSDRALAQETRPATIRGRVLDAKTGAPLAGALVRAGAGGGRRRASPVEATASADGSFVLEGVPAAGDEVRITATAKGFAPAVESVEVPQSDDELTLRLEAAWRAEVRVVDDRGQPVAGVEVRARLPFETPYSALARHDFLARSDSSGSATFDDLVPGQPVVFEITHDPHVPTSSAPAMPHVAEDGSGTSATEIVLTEGRAASVVVQDAFGVPVEDAEVRVLPLVEPRADLGARGESDAASGSVRSGLVDGVGKARFDKLPAELLTAEVRAKGFETRMVTIDLRQSPTAESVVRLDRDPAPPGEAVPWMPSIRDAFGAAEAGGVPVFVAMTMDGERANDWIASHHLRDPEVVRLAEFLPCLVASAFGEGGAHAKDVEHSEDDDVCSRYGSIPCAIHQAVETWCRAEFLNDQSSFPVPRHIFISADGRVLAHRAYYLSERDLRWMMLRALRQAGGDTLIWLCIRRLQPLWREVCAGHDTDARRAAIAALARLVDSGDEYAITLLNGFALDAIAPDVRLQILDAILVPALSDPAGVLAGFLHDPEPAVRLRAWQRLRTVAPRVDVAIAVPAIGTIEDDDSIFDTALRVLRVDEKNGAFAVAESGEDDRWMIVEMLLGRMQAGDIRGLDEVLDATGTEGRNRILRALASAPEDASAQRRLFALAAAPDAGAVAAIRALASIPGESSGRLRDLLLTQARSPNAFVRQEAITQIGQRPDANAMPALEAALADEAAPVRLAAAIGLWRQGSHRGARILADGIGDPELGREALALLEAAYSEAAPSDPESWRRWMAGKGLLPAEK